VGEKACLCTGGGVIGGKMGHHHNLTENQQESWQDNRMFLGQFLAEHQIENWY